MPQNFKVLFGRMTLGECYCLAIRNFELNQTISLWQHLLLKKTYLMMEYSNEDPFSEILPEFKDKLEVWQKEFLKELEKGQKEKLVIMLNEFIVLHLHEQDLMRPDFQ